MAAGLLLAATPASAQPAVSPLGVTAADEAGTPVTATITQPSSTPVAGKTTTIKLAFGSKVSGSLEWQVDGKHVMWNAYTGVDVGTVTDSASSSLWNHVFLTPGSTPSPHASPAQQDSATPPPRPPSRSPRRPPRRRPGPP
ncbi:hypothetical protein ACFWPA_02400 [Rhodococcus sp. NPDC058505]|uniref:hypothetical protein n=1 Tax=unclassified Rhodococcus (in: high G+C Gram-positive bacteria) TaxID=192944 RepID=UPI00365D20D4